MRGILHVAEREDLPANERWPAQEPSGADFEGSWPVCAGLCASQPHHWHVFRGAVLNEQHWVAFWPSIQAVDRAAGPGVHSNGSMQHSE